jgi:hypothetical protein
MKTYEEKKKMAANFPEGTDCLVEIENVKDPKENPFKHVNQFYFNKNIFLIIGKSRKNSC